MFLQQLEQFGRDHIISFSSPKLESSEIEVIFFFYLCTFQNVTFYFFGVFSFFFSLLIQFHYGLFILKNSYSTHPLPPISFPAILRQTLRTVFHLIRRTVEAIRIIECVRDLGTSRIVSFLEVDLSQLTFFDMVLYPNDGLF